MKEEGSGGGIAKSVTVYTVSELAGTIRLGLDQIFPGLLVVEGELSNVKLSQPAGHYYFTLKDSASSLRGVMFRGASRSLTFVPADGLKVVLRGRLTYYEPRGDIQIVAETMEPAGLGLFHLEFRRVREILSREGLLSPERKRPLPPMPRKVALITSPQGAAIWDFLRIGDQQNRLVPIVVVPARMQGAEAAPEIIRALSLVGSLPGVDLVVIARGGGSAEDLWIYNREDLARAILASPVPVVTAIGHEVDVTVADLVADLRVATPTEAAKKVFFDAHVLLGLIDRSRKRLGELIVGRKGRESVRLLAFRIATGTLSRRLSRAHLGVVRAQDRLTARVRDGLTKRSGDLASLKPRVIHPYRRLAGLLGNVAGQRETMVRIVREILGKAHLDHALCSRPLYREDLIGAGPRRLEISRRRFGLVSGIRRSLGAARERQALLSVLLRESDPERPLERGFFILEREGGRGLASAENLPVRGERLRARSRGLAMELEVDAVWPLGERKDGNEEREDL